MSDCIFCKIIAGQIPAKLEFQNDDVVAFRDINPQAPTHILVIPKKHIAKLADVKPDDLSVVSACIAAANEIAARENLSAGYRLVINNGSAAGQTVWHIHWHLLGGRNLSWPPG